MCSLFGLIDCESVLPAKQKNRILNVLARECECRGTDATGIAYHFGGRLRIYKRPLPAHRLKLRIPTGVNVIMGHTRMATQGAAKKNCNNHPFTGEVNGKPFALAHNGVLWNDRELRLLENLPQTGIETDSYAAVQLLEKENALDFDSLKNMAEKVEGSFVFTMLDENDAVWFVKGDNPLCIVRYAGFLLYASTQEILAHAVQRLGLGRPEEVIEPEEGTLLKVSRDGTMETGSFIPQRTFSHWWRYPPYCGDYDLADVAPDVSSELVDVARAMGVSPDEVQALFDYGCSPEEVEELLYDPALLHELAGELLYAY